MSERATVDAGKRLRNSKFEIEFLKRKPSGDSRQQGRGKLQDRDC